MSTRYESVQSALLYSDVFHVAAPTCAIGRDVWPRQPGVFIRAALAEDAQVATEAVVAADTAEQARKPPSRELAYGQFGLVPRWVKSASDAKLR